MGTGFFVHSEPAGLVPTTVLFALNSRLVDSSSPTYFIVTHTPK